MAWLNIAIQVVSPLAAVFTPTMSAIASEVAFPINKSPILLQTHVYRLLPGETTASVAKKYNMTADELRRINQLRTFARGFEHLQPGDELDVPVSALPKVEWENTDNQSAQKIAGLASKAGSAMANNQSGYAAENMARSMVSGAASGEIQQWLNQFGTARVQLDADKNFSLKNSQFDLLVPLYEKQDRLVFTQGSLHRTDSRTQFNLGVGYRAFNHDWMLGGNSFIDYDLSRDHARAGLGVEYWRDFLKLGANSYLRLTHWKGATNLPDYEERPANGWDLRAEGWLPAYPQLGGKLTYEQYYGKEVALFGKDNRQYNPHSLTAGVSYTPIPLLTFNAEHRQGKSGENDARLGLQITYQLGMPWLSQINPQAVSAMRSMAGSRYALVERNNNIVLEYRKKELIGLRTTDLVTGYAGEQKSLGVQLNSQYEVDRLEWSAPELLIAGGQIIQDGPLSYSVILPAYHAEQTGENSYTLSGIAVDKKGNRSNRSDSQITVFAPTISESQSSFTPANSELQADGVSQSTLTLTIKDAHGQPMEVAASDIKLATTQLKSAKVSAPEKQGTGQFAITVTAGTNEETLQLTPTVLGIALTQARVDISNVIPDTSQTSFTVAPDSIPADGNTASLLTLVLKNAAGNLLTGQQAKLSLVLNDKSNPAIVLSALTETATKGTYTATLKGQVSGEYSVMPLFNGLALHPGVKVTLTVGDAAPTKSLISIDNASYVAGSNIHVNIKLQDAQGNAVSGLSAALDGDAVTVPNATASAGDSWLDNGDGSYSRSYQAITAGEGLAATLKLAHWGAAVQSRAFSITGDEQSAKIILDIENNNAIANGSDENKVTATVKDAHDNILSGIKVVFSATQEAVITSASSSTDNQGKANVSLTNTRSGHSQVTVTTQYATASIDMTFDILVGVYEINDQQRLVFYPRTFSLAFIPDAGSEFDSTCFTVRGRVGANNNFSAISDWGSVSMNHSFVGTFNYILTVSNSCARAVSGTVRTQFSRSDASATAMTQHISIHSQ